MVREKAASAWPISCKGSDSRGRNEAAAARLPRRAWRLHVHGKHIAAFCFGPEADKLLTRLENR
jgi:hypothetical protein